LLNGNNESTDKGYCKDWDNPCGGLGMVPHMY
jgi:hypothetical protein